MKTALQLYSVREYTKTPETLAQTLKKVRAAGFEYVETAGFYGMTAFAFADLLDENGLTVVSTHTGFEALTGNFDAVAEEHKIFGTKHLSVPGMPGSMYMDTYEGFAAFAQKLDDYANKLAALGMTISYHNHSHEFKPVGDTCGWDIIYTVSKNVNMQLDTGNAYEGGADPIKWLEKFADKMVTVHFKDKIKKDGRFADCAIGDGELDWKKIAALVKKSPAEYAIVEIEEFSNDPWETLKKSYDNIAGMFA